MKNKKVIIAVAVFVIAAAVAAAGILNTKKAGKESKPEAIEASSVQEEQKTDNAQNDNKNDNKENKNAAQGESGKSEEKETKTPVFMYFVSEEDSDYNTALKVFEELKKEYSGKIEFDLKNVTQDPKLLENFSLVDGNTPALIMDGKEGIVGFEFKTTDKEVLKAEIEKALK